MEFPWSFDGILTRLFVPVLSMSRSLDTYTSRARQYPPFSDRQEGFQLTLTQNDLIIAWIVGIPVAFYLGRLSTKLLWFRAKAEEKYTVAEFVRSRQ
jgi:hypothetical protein